MNTESLLRKVDTVTEASHTPAQDSSFDANTQTLRDSVERALQNYFDNLDGQPVSDVYNMVLSEVEAPLLETVMKYTRDNQTKASTVLGLNRGTPAEKAETVRNALSV